MVEFSSSNSDVYANQCTSSTPSTTLFPDGIVRQYNISSNQSQMINAISSTQGYWGTCICCGINRAVDMIQSQNNNKKKFIVLMTDGAATIECSQQPNSTATADAVQSAWDACNKNITVFTIGFGNDADSAAMQRMNCSGGKYYNATDASALQQAYSEIAGEINKLGFAGQTVNVTGALARSIVHPGSFIEFNYSAPASPFNKLPLGFETDRFGNNISSGTLTVYPNTSVSEAKVTSYSEAKWTDKLVVNGNNVYSLGDFGSGYQLLGDPFAVNIPADNINTGSNSISISTGLNSTTPGGGSNDSRVIYTLLLNGFADVLAQIEMRDF
ncbi:MAG: vWA domain-containing protein, partial [Nanoarchaeota archaeon]